MEFGDLPVEVSCRDRAKSEDRVSECSTVDATNFDDDCSDDSFDCGLAVQTLVIFDWDDTLFPTTWLRQQGFFDAEYEPDTAQKAKVEKLAMNVEATVRIALQFGKVVIVTNAQQGWVEASCAKVMPSLAPVLQEVHIVSARSKYERFTQNPSEWKRRAFAHEVELLHGANDEQLNVVSLGDSLHEQRAVVSVCKDLHNCFSKSLKFGESPSIDELINQHEFVSTCFWDVAEHNGDLDVEIGADNAP
jgi:hypothetical protein